MIACILTVIIIHTSHRIKARTAAPTPYTRGRLPVGLGIATMAFKDYVTCFIAAETEPCFLDRRLAALEGMPLSEERDKALESLHRDALRTSLLLGIQDIQIRELKSALFFDYLVPSDYHKLLGITEQNFEFIKLSPRGRCSATFPAHVQFRKASCISSLSIGQV